MSNRVECGVCCKKYSSTKRVPKFLACFHTYCVHCLQHLHSGGSITCPSCRKQTEIDDVQALQTNFYLVSQDSTSQAASEKMQGDETAEETWFWCGSCENIAVKACENASHERYGLSTAFGKEMTESHIKTNQLTCRLQWEASLSKRKEIEKTLEGIMHSLQNLLQEVGILAKNNKQKLKQTEANLKELTESPNSVGKMEKASEKSLASLFQKYNDLVSVSKADSKEMTSLSLAFTSMQNALITLYVKDENKGKFDVPFVNGKKINFLNEGPPSRNSHALTVLSYLILSSTPEGKILQQQEKNADMIKKQKAIEAAKCGSKPQMNSVKIYPSKETVAGARAKVPQPHKAPPFQDPKKSSKHQFEGKGGKQKDGKPCAAPPKSKPAPMNRQCFNPNANQKFQQQNLQNVFSNQQQPQVPLEAVLQLMKVASLPSLDLVGKKCFLEVSVNGNPYGRLVIELRPDVAPTMCQRFAQACIGKDGPSYQGTMVFKCEPKSHIIGGRTAGTGNHFIADSSPLKRARGAILLRLKKDAQQAQCPVVSNEFIVQLNNDRKDGTWSSTVFGFVTEGLAICDAISHLDPKKDHIALSKTGII